MIKLIVIILLFLATLAIVPMLIGEKGYLLIAMGDYTIESSVVTAAIMLTLLFIVLFIVIKMMRGGFKLSLGAWNTLVFAGRRRGQRDLNKGIAAFLLSDYKQAEHLLAKSAEPSQQPQIAYLMAASAAQAQQLSANTDHYLQLVAHQEKTLKEVGLESILVNIHLLMRRQEYKKARTLIDEHHRHIGHDARLLSLEIDLCIAEQRYKQAIEHLASARKNKAITDEQVRQWENIAYKCHFEQLIHDGSLPTLLEGWQSIPRKLKQRENIILVYCQVLADKNIIEPLQKLLLPVIKKGANTTFIDTIKSLPIQQPREFIVVIEKHLQKDPDNTIWLSCLGHLAFTGNDFALAEKAFNRLKQKLEQPMPQADSTIFAQALIKQGKADQAAHLLLAYHKK